MRKEWMIGAAFALLCFLVYRGNPSFAGPQNVTSLLERVVPLGIVALGIGLVIVTGGIDLSVGSVMGLAAVALAKAHLPVEESGLGWRLWPSIALALGLGAGAGLAQGLLVARLRLPPFIVTLAGMLFLRGLAETVSGSGTLSPDTDAWNRFCEWRKLGVRIPWPEALRKGPNDPAFVMFSGLTIALAALALVLAYLLHCTVFGRHLYALGGNREAARYSGVPVARTETFAYVLSGLLAAVAGVCNASMNGSGNAIDGATFELYAIAAAVLGGCALAGGEGTILGILIGVALFKVLENGFTLNQPAVEAWTRGPNVPGWLRPIFTERFAVEKTKNMVYGAVILAAVLLDRGAAAWRDARRRRSAK